MVRFEQCDRLHPGGVKEHEERWAQTEKQKKMKIKRKRAATERNGTDTTVGQDKVKDKVAFGLRRPTLLELMPVSVA